LISAICAKINTKNKISTEGEYNGLYIKKYFS
jgi:hypothetical protein